MVTASDPDAPLVREYQNSLDPAIFEKLVTKYQARVYRYCFRFLGNDADAADCCQDVFIKVYRGVAGFRFGSTFHTWLYRIMVNTCRDVSRSKAYRVSRDASQVEDLHADGPGSVRTGSSREGDPEQALRNQEINRLFREGLTQLNPKQRTVLLLRDVDGHSYEEIAEMTGLRIGTVRSVLARARGRMAETLNVFRHEL